MADSMTHKIKDLFSYRELPTLPTLSNKGDFKNEKLQLFNKLEYLQKTIYDLDQVLETNYKVDTDLVEQKWSAIYQALNSLGIDDYDEYCADIYRYQKHELSIREGDAILRLPMEFFYYFKSCDVKLIRRIIYKRYADLNEIMPLEMWKAFDLITEINDDIDDIFEDIGTNNGNRFLLEIQKFGLEKTQKHFNLFLTHIHEKYCVKKDINLHPLILERTLQAYHNTLKLMDVRSNQIRQDGLYASNMLS